jgi:hypothetical protein
MTTSLQMAAVAALPEFAAEGWSGSPLDEHVWRHVGPVEQKRQGSCVVTGDELWFLSPNTVESRQTLVDTAVAVPETGIREAGDVMAARGKALHRATAVTGAALVTAGFLGHGTASAQATYDSFAQATAFEISIGNQSIPTGIDVQGGGPEADARQTSYGVGDASAQTPYAGGTVPGLPGTAGALFGLPVPPYPLIASSNKGSDPQTTSYPGLTLSAASRDYSTEAQALLGQEASGSKASSRIDQAADGSVTATATSESGTLKAGNVLELDGVRTVATVSADGTSGKLTRTATTSISRISVPGLVMEIPSQTPSQVGVPVPIPGVPNLPPQQLPVFPVPLGGTTIANPNIGVQDGYFTVTVPSDGSQQRFLIPAGAALSALKAAGVTMTFQQPEKFTNGIQSGSYVFSYTIPAPPQNSYYTGPTKVTQSTGRALAKVDLHPVADSGSGGGSFPPVTSTVGNPVDGGTGTGAVSSPVLGSQSGEIPSSSVGSEPPPSGPAPTLDGSAGTSAGLPVRLAGSVTGSGIGNLYLALVGVALLGLSSATVLRKIGVTQSWAS